MQVFLSYRRNDVGGYAGRLSDALRERLGAKSVFQDVTTIELGEAFTAAIDRAIGGCDAVLAVIGPGWLTASTPEGSPRLQDPHDYVRLELARALHREVRVVPILVGGARLPTADALPEDIRGLVERQGIVLRDESWHQDVETLVRSLRGEPVVPIRHSRRRLWAGAAAVALAASGLLAWLIAPFGGGGAGASLATELPTMTATEDNYPACPAPNGDGWHAVTLRDPATGAVKTTTGSLTFTVKYVRWRELTAGKWMVSLDTEMTNHTTADFPHGSWDYNYLVVGNHQFELNPGGCFATADEAFVKPRLTGDARAGFVVSCRPAGAIVVSMAAGNEQLGDDAAITVTRATKPAEC